MKDIYVYFKVMIKFSQSNLGDISPVQCSAVEEKDAGLLKAPYSLLLSSKVCNLLQEFPAELCITV